MQLTDITEIRLTLFVLHDKSDVDMLDIKKSVIPVGWSKEIPADIVYTY